MKGDEWERTRAVERALELGINYFDTASTYEKGMSESNLGAALLARTRKWNWMSPIIRMLWN